MVKTKGRRPKRLWVVGALNVLSGLVGIGALFVLAYAASAPEALRPGLITWLMSGGIALFLLAATTLTLCGVPRAQYVMLGAAVIFFGVIIEQNVEFLVSPIDLGGELPQARLFGAIVRSGVMIGLNFWVALSQPMRDFMLGARMERT